MTYFKNNSKLISMLMVTIMLLTAAPYHAAYAKMISTGTTVDTQRVETARDFMQNYMAREDVRQEILSMGVSPEEADVRVSALSDAEIVSLADTIQESPAGASAVGAIVGGLPS